MAVVSSVNAMSYGGNHIIRPPFMPFSHEGKSSNCIESRHAKFSRENIYFLALFSPKASILDILLSLLLPLFTLVTFNSEGWIFKLPYLSNTEFLSFLFNSLYLNKSVILEYGLSFVHTLHNSDLS